MPIANCFVGGERRAGGDEIDGLTALWSEESGIGDDYMTINVIPNGGQSGVAYDVMAFLYLPSLWSSDDVQRLQVGLAVEPQDVPNTRDRGAPTER